MIEIMMELNDNRFYVEFISLDILIPKNHLVRKIDKF
jgi:hypothetical protein